MYTVEVHQGINKMMKTFHLLGFWHKGDETTAGERRIKLYYSIHFFLLFVSILVGAFISNNAEESIFLFEESFIVLVLLVKFFHVVWRKKEILDLLHRIAVHSIEDQKLFTTVNGKLEIFMKFIAVIVYTTFFGSVCALLGVPLLGSERKQFLNVGFPFDWKTSEIVYWVEFAFIFIGLLLSLFGFLFSILMWYLLFNCALKYDVIANRLRNMATVRRNKKNISPREMEKLFVQDLIDGIRSHEDIINTTEHLGSFLSNVLSIQLATSSLCICCSIYCLAFNEADILEFVVYLNYLVYNFHDIFMVMYYGNEIKLSSESLLYSLFESSWPDRSQSYKKCLLIFGERLKMGQTLMILKLYPLTLETFTRILNSAYSMFNILKNLK